MAESLNGYSVNKKWVISLPFSWIAIYRKAYCISAMKATKWNLNDNKIWKISSYKLKLICKQSFNDDEFKSWDDAWKTMCNLLVIWTLYVTSLWGK